MSKDKNKREQKQEAQPNTLDQQLDEISSRPRRGYVDGPDGPREETDAELGARLLKPQSPQGESPPSSFAERVVSEAEAAFRSRADVLVTDAILGKEAGQALRSEGVQAAVRAIEAKEQRESCIKALKALVGAKLWDRLEGPLREVISDLTEGTVNAAIKNRLEIIAAVCHDDAVKKALEALA